MKSCPTKTCRKGAQCIRCLERLAYTMTLDMKVPVIIKREWQDFDATNPPLTPDNHPGLA